MIEQVVRFSARQRLEHLVTMVLFALLCLTGLPQKFYIARWAEELIRFWGGIDRARWIHRFCGWALAAATVFHATVAIAAVVRKKSRLSMMVTRRDFEDAIATLQYYLGLREAGPGLDRFDYKQKFEYWSLLAGNVVMILTGVVLIYPTVLSLFLPGELVPAAKVAHSSGGLLAFSIVIFWHIFNAHLNPDVFPFDPCIFTGKISRARMLREHPLELARLEGRAEAQKEEGGHGPRELG